MSLTVPPEKRLANAMIELGFAFLENPPFSDVTATHAARLRTLLSGPGTWEEIARRLDAVGREEIADAFWRLYGATLHAFYKEMTKPQ
jgi:hypothetical protein